MKRATSNGTQPQEDIVHLGEDIVVPKQNVLCPEEDLVRREEVIGGNEESLVQPEGDDFYPEGDTLIKDISVFHAGAGGKFVPRSCVLDSAAPVNLISEAAVKGIQCDIKPGTGEVRGLGSVILPVIGTVKLSFRFWDREEIFEAEFHVLRSRKVFGHQFDPGFDCLLCWNWMKTHPRAWNLCWRGQNERQ
jgi:hypothetical protein